MTQDTKCGIVTTHPDYDDHVAKWNMVDDVIKSDVNKYLRDVSSCEADKVYAVSRQKDYEDGAILMNFTLNTRNGMQGAVFLKPPTIEVPTQLEYLLTDADGNGVSLEQQAQSAVDQDLRKGRLALLVDFPSVEEVPNIKQMESGEVVPRIQLYIAQNIVNWRTRRVGSINLLSMVVLREAYEDEVLDIRATNYFNNDCQHQYRLLGIDEDGNYFQQVYKIDSNGEYKQDGITIYPRQAGKLMRKIPLFFIGSEDNDYTVDSAPLFPIAELNVGHYRNSADTEESAWVASQAMLIIAPGEIDAETWQNENPNGVKIGSRRGLNVGSGGSAMFIQAEASDKSMELMKLKEEQAIAIGAQLVTPSTQITAESARVQQGGNNSSLSNISNNVTEAYRGALAQCALFLGVNPDSIDFKLNQDFFFEKLTFQDRAQWVSEVMSGITPLSFLRMKYREAGVYPDDYTDEMIDEEIMNQQPMGVGLPVEETEEEDLNDGN